MRIKWAAGLMAAFAALAGCSTQTNVSMGTSVQSKYSHVWLTFQEVWFNTSATASPEDSSWKRFTLSAPITLDLATLTSGSLQQIATGVKVPAGTYSQLRLIPVDSSAALAASASAAGAKYNAEADYTDPSGNAQQAPLELLNPDKGIGVSTTLTVKASLAQLGSLTTATTSTTSCLPGAIGCTSGSTSGGTSCSAGTTDCMSPSGTACVNGETDCTTTAVATAAPASSSAATMSVAVTVDGIHDLVQFAYGNANDPQIGVLLNPHSSGYDVTSTGTIQGTVDLTNVTADSSGHFDVQATAETLSTDGTRHVAVQTVQVGSDGKFVLYPLPAATPSTTSTGLATTSRSTTPYDLVIHGPQIATVIIKSIPVAAGDPSTTAAASVGTVTPRAATPYTFNMAAGTVALPAGALVDLYQTIPASGEVPYVVDQVAIDPFSRTLLYNESVPTGTLDWGTYVSGANVALTTVTPTQGSSVYFISAQAPLFSDQGQLVATLSPPANGTGPVPVVMPTLTPTAGSGSVSVTVAPVTAGKYDRGELIVSHDGAIVQTVAIDTALTQNGGATLTVQGIPAGGSASSFDNAVYYVSTRAWNSSNPAGTLQRQSFTTPIDLSSGSATGPTVNVD
ncbi:MAG TPA: DUF4382 domain-containing protein [Steroidobacteraceae bacterium]|nr:DUF4382 domain-containing protein [Steroidobacteraceae bacterium]